MTGSSLSGQVQLLHSVPLFPCLPHLLSLWIGKDRLGAKKLSVRPTPVARGSYNIWVNERIFLLYGLLEL